MAWVARLRTPSTASRVRVVTGESYQLSAFSMGSILAGTLFPELIAET